MLKHILYREIVVVIAGWSLFQSGHKVGVYCTTEDIGS